MDPISLATHLRRLTDRIKATRVYQEYQRRFLGAEEGSARRDELTLSLVGMAMMLRKTIEALAAEATCNVARRTPAW